MQHAYFVISILDVKLVIVKVVFIVPVLVHNSWAGSLVLVCSNNSHLRALEIIITFLTICCYL